MNNKITTRFAPSPTGFMHVGNLRTALYAYLVARKYNGDFILRIEDTDKEREVPGSIEHIMKVLEWIGMEWDYGPNVGGPNSPYTQSERLDLYKQYAQKLIDGGFAYPDPYTEEQVEEFRKKAENEKRPFLFRDHRPETFENWDGKKTLRFKVPEIKSYKWHDLVFGDLQAGPEALDDFVLIKSDGYPTYNFCHIVDDIEMKITHVIRGQEYISSTPKYLALYEALGIEPPLYVCLPHILGKDGNKKLGKRDGAKDALQYKEEGYLPEAMVNFLALLGWHPQNDQEIFSIDELIKSFEIDRIQKSGAQWNDEKLNWMNREYLKKLSLSEQIEYVKKFVPQELNNEETIKKITPIIIERISKGQDIITMYENGELTYFFETPKYDKDSLFFKSSKIEGDRYTILSNYLKKLVLIIEEVEDFNIESIKEKVWPFAEEIGRGDILWPMRFALSGVQKSPDPFVLAYILGKEETISRINNAIVKLNVV